MASNSTTTTTRAAPFEGPYVAVRVPRRIQMRNRIEHYCRLAELVSAPKRLLFQMYYKHGYSSLEISQLLMVHHTTVCRRLHRVRSELDELAQPSRGAPHTARRSAKMDSITLRRRMLEKGLSVKEGPLMQRIDHLEKALRIVLPTVTRSDRTCYRKVSNWLFEKCCADEAMAAVLLPRVIDFALEASGPNCRNPAAVFMSILKKELAYPK